MAGALFWLILAAMTLGVIAVLVMPLLRPSSLGWRRADFNRQVYRDQLRELAADVERGVITADEADAARVEIQRRLIAADETSSEGAEVSAGGGTHRAAAVGVALLVPIVGLSVYVWLGDPDAMTASPERPHPPLTAGAQRATPPPPTVQAQTQASGKMEAHELDANIAKLRTRLEQQPNDLQGWMLLARSLTVVERHSEAATAYQKAAELDPGTPDVKTSAAEAMVMASGGRVTEEAVAVFREVLSVKPSDPASRYYIAMSKAQAGEFRDAFDGWRSLLLDAPADAPWREPVAQRVREMADRLGIDVATAVPQAMAGASAARPMRPTASNEEGRGPTAEDMAAAAKMSPEERQQMIRGMVEGLATRLEDEPNDPEGWQRLVRVYGVLGEREKAYATMARAVVSLPDDVGALLNFAGALMQARAPDDPIPEAAVTAFERILKINPGNPGALFYMGQVQAEAGETDEARATWGDLLRRLDPVSPSYTTVKRALEQLP